MTSRLHEKGVRVLYRRTAHRTVLLILAMATILGGAPAEEEAPDLVTDRPDQTESSETVGPGYVQLEFGWLHVENSDA